jgi:ABC-type polysaccharide/polyol phosphate export permease
MQAVRFKVSYIYAASRASKCFNYTGLQAAISGVLIWLSWTSASADFVAIIAILMFIVVTQLSSALYYETVVKRYLRSPGPAITP